MTIRVPLRPKLVRTNSLTAAPLGTAARQDVAAKSSECIQPESQKSDWLSRGSLGRMRWARCIAFLEVGAALWGSSCKSEGEIGGCVTGSGPLAECETTFCGPVSHHVVINDLDGNAQLKSQTPGEAPSGKYLGLMYTAPDAVVYLSFAVEPDGHIGAFQYFWVEVYFGAHEDGGRGDRIFNQPPAFWGSERWERLEIVDGRVKGIFKYEAGEANRMIKSRSPDCVSGDIAGECYCNYEPLKIPIVLDVDVALP